MTLRASSTLVPAGSHARQARPAGAYGLPALAAAFIVFQSALTGFSTQMEVMGGMSVQGFLTLVYAAVAVVLVISKPHVPRAAFRAFWPMLLFLAYTVLAFAWYPPTIVGLQNVSVFSAFAGLTILSAAWAKTDAAFPRVAMKAFWWAVAFASLQYLLVVGVYGFGTTENPIMPARSFAIFALLGLAAALGGWRYGNRNGLYLAVLVVGTIGISLSRTSLIVAVVMLALMWIPARGVKGWLRLVALAAVAIFALFWSINNVPALHARFFEGDVTLGSGALAVNASGRTLVWNVVLESWKDSPWIGKGPGSVNPPLEERVPDRGINGHPHNDYLRVLHEYGVLGLAIFAFALVNLMYRLFRLWAREHPARSPAAPLLLAAMLGLVGFMGMMTTDNPIVYGFFMAPLAILVGTALGAVSNGSLSAQASTR